MNGLRDLLRRHVEVTEDGRDEFFDLVDYYYSPGYWTAYAARARLRKLRCADLNLPKGNVSGYAHAIGIEHALGEGDTYPYSRKSIGKKYSPLVLLENVDQTDAATGQINDCIRGLFGEEQFDEFARAMCDLVGDLHDNVWSHGQSTGFSMAQKWSGIARGEFLFEFAVADAGYGFLRELHRAGRNEITNDAEAIAWCIERGNSTKRRDVSEWSQRLPPDMMGNPIRGIGEIVESDYHHLGLGLAKLISAVERFGGRLWLASGEAMLVIRPNAGRVYEKLPIPWKGVALACRFNSARVRAAMQAQPANEFADALSKILGG